jgi:hypothetical protein
VITARVQSAFAVRRLTLAVVASLALFLIASAPGAQAAKRHSARNNCVKKMSHGRRAARHASKATCRKSGRHVRGASSKASEEEAPQGKPFPPGYEAPEEKTPPSKELPPEEEASEEEAPQGKPFPPGYEAPGEEAGKFKLTVKKTGAGTGKVTSSPAGINCGASCLAEFEEGKEVTLTASADPGFEFKGWSGSGCSGTGTCKVTMTEAKEVTATFDKIPAEINETPEEEAPQGKPFPPGYEAP